MSEVKKCIEKQINWAINPSDNEDFYYATSIDEFNELLKRVKFNQIKIEQPKKLLNHKYSKSIFDLFDIESSVKREDILKYFSRLIVRQEKMEGFSLTVQDILLYDAKGCQAINYPCKKHDNGDLKVGIRFNVTGSIVCDALMNKNRYEFIEEFKLIEQSSLCSYSDENACDFEECAKDIQTCKRLAI